jgi:hypothetical protein
MEQQALRRRVRKPTQYGTCQACGDVVALALSSGTIQKHGYVVIDGHDRIACAGSGYAPIEVSRERGEALVKLYRQQLADLRAHGRDTTESVVPRGLSGASALRARFAGDTDVLAARQGADVSRKITDAEKRLRRVEDTLLTGAANIPLIPKASPTHRINALFRRNKDQMVYIVESAEPPTHSQMARNKRLAPTYICRNVETGKRLRVTQNELTRALNEQAPVLIINGEPQRAIAESNAA